MIQSNFPAPAWLDLKTFAPKPFAAAVIVSHMVGGPSRIADILAVLYILVRIGHMTAYIAGRQPLRTAAFGQLVALAIFIMPLFSLTTQETWRRL